MANNTLPGTPNAEAIQQANAAANLVRQFLALAAACSAYQAQYNAQTPDTYWKAMATQAVNADGTLAATNDASPNNSNPLSVTTYPTLQFCLSEAALSSFYVNVISQIVTLSQNANLVASVKPLLGQ